MWEFCMDKTINLWGLVKKQLNAAMQVETLGGTPSHKGTPPARKKIHSYVPTSRELLLFAGAVVVLPGYDVDLPGLLLFCRELVMFCRGCLCSAGS